MHLGINHHVARSRHSLGGEVSSEEQAIREVCHFMRQANGINHHVAQSFTQEEVSSEEQAIRKVCHLCVR
jgi:mannitol/fructose-specific phosphotransferase system IIA component (Ntr-type)